MLIFFFRCIRHIKNVGKYERRSMEANVISDAYKERLKKDIEELRDILNEICVIHEEMGQDDKTLIISQRLDKLIVKYMMAMKE